MQQWRDLLQQSIHKTLSLRPAKRLVGFCGRTFRKTASLRPAKWMMKDRRHTTLALSGLGLIVIALVVFLAVLLSPQTLREPGFCLVGDNLVKLMQGQKATGTAQSIQIRSFGSGSKLDKKSDGYTVRSTGGDRFQMAGGFPVFTNQGASVYLYNSRFTLITTDFKAKKAPPRSYVSNGKVYNDSNRRTETASVLLVRLSNGLYVNTQALTIQTVAQSLSVPVNSVLSLGKDAIACMTPSDGKRQITRLAASGGVAVVGFDKKTFAYEAFLNKIGAGGKAPSSTAAVTDNLYQYYMGKRYDYAGDKVFYTSAAGVFMSWSSQVSLISTQPLYYEKTQKLILPSDYIVVQPQFASMYKLPALSAVFSDQLATYTKSASRVNTYVKFFLFNGTDTYIFPTGADLNAGGQTMTLAPYSSVVMGRDGTVGVYEYNGQYTVLNVTAKQSVTAKTGDSSTLSLSENTLTFSNGQKMMLFQKPSLLQEDNQKKK